MKDYVGRMEELTAFAVKEYGIDPTEIQIIAASLMPSARPCWLVVDSPLSELWLHLGARALPPIRGARPRQANEMVGKLMEKRAQPTLFHDRLWDEMMPTHQRSEFRFLEEELLRLRVPLPYDKTPRLNAESQLGHLLRLAIDAEHRQAQPVPLPNPSEMLNHAVHLLTLLNPALKNHHRAMDNIRILITSHAVLYGRERIESEDHWAIRRVIQDSIRPWTTKLMRAFGLLPGYTTIPDLMTATGLDRPLVVKECIRLAAAGILEWGKTRDWARGNPRGKWLGLKTGMGMDAKRLVEGTLDW